MGSRKSDYHRLYNTAAWASLRLRIIARDYGRCQHCGIACHGVEPEPDSPVVHHRTPHKGDRKLFYDADNLTLVCKACHDGPIQAAEKGSRMQRADGW